MVNTHTDVVGMTGRNRVQRVLILPVTKQFSQCKPSLQFLSSKHVFPSYLTITNKINTRIFKDYVCQKSNENYRYINIKLRANLAVQRMSDERNGDEKSKNQQFHILFCAD